MFLTREPRAFMAGTEVFLRREVKGWGDEVLDARAAAPEVYFQDGKFLCTNQLQGGARGACAFLAKPRIPSLREKQAMLAGNPTTNPGRISPAPHYGQDETGDIRKFSTLRIF